MCPFTTSALHSLCLVRASFANKQNSTAEGRGLGCWVPSCCLCVEPELSHSVYKKKISLCSFKKSHENTLSFFPAVQNNISVFKKIRSESRKPVPPFPPSLCLKELQATPALLAHSESLTGFLAQIRPRALVNLAKKLKNKATVLFKR